MTFRFPPNYLTEYDLTSSESWGPRHRALSSIAFWEVWELASTSLLSDNLLNTFSPRHNSDLSCSGSSLWEHGVDPEQVALFEREMRLSSDTPSTTPSLPQDGGGAAGRIDTDTKPFNSDVKKQTNRLFLFSSYTVCSIWIWREADNPQDTITKIKWWTIASQTCLYSALVNSFMLILLRVVWRGGRSQGIITSILCLQPQNK